MKFLKPLAAVLVVLVLTGCGLQKPGDTKSSSGSAQQKQQSSVQKPQPKPEKPAQMATKVYFPNDDGTRLVPVAKNVKTDNKYQDAIEVLIQGTHAKGMTGIFPKGVRLKSVQVKNGLATVDFSAELTKKFIGGSTGELMLVGSIVQTLTEFPEVKKVQLTVEGKEIDSISGHLDTSEPFVRNDKQLEL